MRFVAHLWPILFLACVDRTLDDSATGGTSTGATGTTTATTPSSASDTTPATTTPPTTGPSTSTTTTTTTGPSTSGPSSAVTTDVTATTDPPDMTTGPVKLDFPRTMAKPPGLVDCTLAAPPGTAVKGFSSLGPFESERAYFGGVDINGELLTPVMLFLSPGADAATELMGQQGSTGPIFATGEVATDFYDHWLGKWESPGLVIDKGKGAEPAVTIAITQFAGNWNAPDPNDPPRLLGELSGDLVGPFDAVYCNMLDIGIIAE